MVNKLKNQRVYLAGPIQYCSTGGITWRQLITPKLKELEIVVLDPTNKPTNEFKESPEDAARRRKLKSDGRLFEVRDEMRPIRNYDLRLTDLADFIICYVNRDIYTIGTVEELSRANLSKKPCLIYHDGPIEDLGDWLLAMFPVNHFFFKWEDMFDYLKKINEGLDDKTDRWRFIDFSLL